MTEFQVCKDNLAETRKVDTVDLNLAKGEVLVKVDRFGFSANNITHGMVGEMMKYWNFFPASGVDAGGWGIIPV